MEESVSNIRQSNRSLLQLNRRTHRDEINDVRRTLDKCATPENVKEIINKLKTKSATSAKELNLLKNALLEDAGNIEILLNVHGALRGLVRELTGIDVRKQCAAAGCICNLALGDTKACSTVAKATGTYLVAAVDNFATELAVTCTWTLGNLAASGKRVSEILISQGVLSKLTEPHSNEEVQEACWYALKHFAYQMGDDLKLEHLHKILETLTIFNLSLEASQVLFIVSCHNDFTNIITEELLIKLLEHFAKSMEKHLLCKQTNLCCDLVYICRTLANTNSFVCSLVLKFLRERNMSDLCKKVLSIDNKTVNETLLWLLGNVYNNCDNKDFFDLLIS